MPIYLPAFAGTHCAYGYPQKDGHRLTWLHTGIVYLHKDGYSGIHLNTSSSSRMCVMNHNWSATKQRLHPLSVAEISRHSVLSGDSIRRCETSSGSRCKDTDQCL